MQKMQEIADGYPAIIVGDFNAYYSEKAMYNTFNAYLDDSRKVTQTAPVGPGTTFAQWNPAVTGGEPIDYVFLRSGECAFLRDDYRRLRERNYASDHLPILITCTFKDNLERGKWYVSTLRRLFPMVRKTPRSIFAGGYRCRFETRYYFYDRRCFLSGGNIVACRSASDGKRV